MSQEKTNEKESETWMDNLLIKDTFQKENISFHKYSEFQNLKLINTNIFKSTFKISPKTVTLKNVYSNDKDKFTPDNLINEIKRHRKLEIYDIILFYGITEQENINEYVNEGSLRQYLKPDFQKLDWNAKLNFAKQIANVLMFLHSNNIIHGKFNSENILHDGITKLNIFGLTKFISDSLRFDCWKHNGNSRPDISEIIISDASVEFEIPQSQPYVTDVKLENLNIQNEEPEIKPDLPFDDDFINDLFEIFIDNSENILHDGITKLNIFGLTKFISDSLRFDCWKHNGNSRPDISEIIISDASVEFEIPQSQPYVTDVKLENLNIQNEEPEIKPDLPFDDDFINDLFEIFIDVRKKQFEDMEPIIIKNYFREHKKDPVEILYKMIRHPFYYLFTSLIGFFYRYGIGTAVDYQMAFKFFNLAATNEIIDTSSSNSSSLRKLYNINKEISTASLADMYLDGIGVEKDTKKAFRIYYELACKGSLIALTLVAYCYQHGFGVEKNEEKAFELYLKSAEKGNIAAQSSVGGYYECGMGVAKDETKAFQWAIKSALAGNIDAMYNVGYFYDYGIGVCEDKKEAFKWFLKAAEKGFIMAQYNLGGFYKYGYGIDRDEVKAFEWYKKAAENYDEGKYRLGECFYEGCGTKKDIVKAIYWLNKATENGNTNAKRLLEEIIYSTMY
ncbi:hypothetical protein Glove_140g57 [Diversispora epigaea]|uniref:Protein kinase domain-containing protein n=1 Tax=Diversispora epigaea TaxID=1348612 RepID=A0A397IXU4_9GLOM|nr:hypothetical protein Glove_140g57 [Diversispora epigaea]